MKLRYLLILGVLVFLNGFVFTVLLLMVSREVAEPAPTPTMVVTTGPTLQPTFTSTPVGPTPTFTVEPTATNTPEPTPTNTLVVEAPTATHTVALATPTATSPPATATATGATATSTTAPPTATSTTPAPTATATTAVSYEFRYAGGMESAPNCGTVYMRGKITGVGGEPVDGRTVRLRFAGNTTYKVSGDGEDPGVWGFAPLATEHYHSPFTFLIDVVESEGNPVPQSDTVEISFTDCGVAGQFTNIVFAYNW
jgi:hypothetical protein